MTSETNLRNVTTSVTVSAEHSAVRMYTQRMHAYLICIRFVIENTTSAYCAMSLRSRNTHISGSPGRPDTTSIFGEWQKRNDAL